MKIVLAGCLLVAVIAGAVPPPSRDDVMYSSSDGQVKYWLNCEFHGNDVEDKPSTLGQCGSVCLANPNCIHFTWTDGVCYMKNTKDIEFRTRLDGAVCGFVKCRIFDC